MRSLVELVSIEYLLILQIRARSRRPAKKQAVVSIRPASESSYAGRFANVASNFEGFVLLNSITILQLTYAASLRFSSKFNDVLPPSRRGALAH